MPTREEIEAFGVANLVVDDLRPDDLERIAWSGSRSHLKNVAERLGQAARGELDYLVVRAPDGEPICKGAICYERPDAGLLMQIATRHELEGLGLASRLVAVAEDKIRARDLSWALLGVEEENVRAKSLYVHLGYESYDVENASWPSEDEAGNETVHHAVFTMMRKRVRGEPLA